MSLLASGARINLVYIVVELYKVAEHFSILMAYLLIKYIVRSLKQFF